MARVGPWLRQSLVLLALVAALLILSFLVVRACSPAVQPAGDGFQDRFEVSLRELVIKQLSLDPHYQLIENPAVVAELDRITKRLAVQIEPPLKWPLRILLVKNADANAMTLPGGTMLVFTGLLQDAASAEEVAAVLAHEMGHMKYEDPLNALKRNIAISVLISAGTGTVSPQTVDEIVQILTESAFSRSVEERADRFALDLLAKSRIRPGHLADFFRSLTRTPLEKAVGKQLSWLGSHPDTDSRIKRADEADAAFTGTEEPLDIDWPALQAKLRK